MALIQRVASSSFPEKSEGRAAFSSVCEDMGGGAGVTRGIGLVVGGGFPGMGGEGMLGDEGGKG